MDLPRDCRPLSGYVKVAAAASLWDTWSLFFRPAERGHAIAPAVEAFIVFSVILLAVAPGAWRERPRALRSAGAWAVIVWLGVGDAFNTLLFFWAMQRMSLAIATDPLLERASGSASRSQRRCS